MLVSPSNLGLFQSSYNGAETITISDTQDFIYAIYAYDFSNQIDYPLRSSGATLQYYSYSGGALEYQVPTTEPTSGAVSRFWMIGCLDPRVGFKGVNSLIAGFPSDTDLASYCFK